jgi:hypothetical protein
MNRDFQAALLVVVIGVEIAVLTLMVSSILITLRILY